MQANRVQSMGEFSWAVDAGDETELRFRRFRLLPGARILLRDDEAVDLGSRAFDLLHVLLERRGTVVSKTEITVRVWPTTLVDESNLRFQISCLRRVLGEDRDLIKTVPGRGYLLAAESTAPDRLGGPQAAGGGGRTAAMLAEERQTSDSLRRLLRSVLDELWQMTAQEQRYEPRRPHALRAPFP